MSLFTHTRWAYLVLLVCPGFIWPVMAASQGVPTANSRPSTLASIAVTATRLSQQIPNLGIDADHIDLDTEKAQGHLDVHSVLRSHPLLSTSAVAGTSGIFMGGLGSQHTRVFVDGIDIKDAIGTQGGPYTDLLLMDNFASVDILPMSFSSLYGADSMGGIVAFRSNLEHRFFKHYIRSDYTSSAFQWHATTEIGHLALQHATLKDSSFSAYTKGTEKDPKNIQNSSIFHTLTFEPFTLHTVYKHLEGDTALDSDSEDVADKMLYAKQDILSTTATLVTNETDNIALRYTQHALSRKDNFYGDWGEFFGQTESVQLTQEMTFQNIHLLSGYERYTESGQTSWNAYHHQDRDNLFTRALVSMQNHTLSIGYRQEFYDGPSFGSYDIGLGSTWDKLFTRASLSKGNRFASISEWTYNHSQNLEIHPESSLTYRLEAEYPIGPVTAGALYFDTKIQNKIDYNDDTKTYFNQDEDFISHGYQYRLALIPMGILNILDLTYVVQQSHQGSTQALRVPNHKAVLRAQIHHDKWRIGSTLTAVGSRTDKVSSKIVTLDSYTDLSASIHYDWSNTVTLSLTGTNLLSQNIELVKNYYTTGTTLTAGIDLSL